MGLPVGGGIGGLVLLLLISALTGTNPLDLISRRRTRRRLRAGPDAALRRRRPAGAVHVASCLKDTEDTWTSVFRERGGTYQPPTLVLFTDATQSACGVGQSAMGPFYCPADRKVYLDLSFFRGARSAVRRARRLRAGVRRRPRGRASRADADRDCRSACSARGSARASARATRCRCGRSCRPTATPASGAITRRSTICWSPGDAEEGLRAAAAIGDDRLQRQSQGRVVPESFTHGSSEQRVSWLRRGLESGQLEACDTFSARR